jgi:transposase-like protein
MEGCGRAFMSTEQLSHHHRVPPPRRAINTHNTHTHTHTHPHAHGSQLVSRVFAHAQSVKHYKCQECTKMFEKRTHMFRHYKAKHDPTVYQQGTYAPASTKNALGIVN